MPYTVSKGVLTEVDMGLYLVDRVGLNEKGKWAGKIIVSKSNKINDVIKIFKAISSRNFDINSYIKFVEKFNLNNFS